ncbi:MAG: hypothetical protein SFW09_00735 [Hyphomicrobiaceae bacterium]|nr:hypothetical protein [Hyphomicrobiaceae bacterium]
MSFNVAAGLVLDVRSWWTDYNQSSPECFLYNAAPHKPGHRHFDRSDGDATGIEEGHDAVVAAMGTAARQCTMTRCDSAARNAYQKAIKKYVETRGQALARLDVRYGDRGLDWGRHLYGRQEDREIVNDFRRRHASGLVDIAAMRDYAPAARMLLYRPSADFLPCRRAIG